MSLNGIIVIDKPKGYTSFEVVKEVRKRFKIKKVGHTGTLDPLATGVMIVCVGEATKLVNYLMGKNKIYESVLKLGYKSESYDVQSELIKVPFTKKLKTPDIKKTVKSFKGEYLQKPPMYSAKKVNGVRLYELARKKIKVERKIEKVNIYNIEVIDIDLNNKEIKFETEVSKGTYIRTLCYDIGKKLGTAAVMKDLIRLKNGDYSINDCVNIEKMTSKDIIPMNRVLPDMPKVIIKNSSLIRVRNGASVSKFDIKNSKEIKMIPVDKVSKLVSEKDNLIALGKVIDNKNVNIKTIRVFN